MWIYEAKRQTDIDADSRKCGLMQSYNIKMSNNLNAKSNIDIGLYIVVSTYNVIEQIEYQ